MNIVRPSFFCFVVMPYLTATTGLAQVSVPPEFTVEVFATIDRPSGLAFAPVGSVFGSDLFVGSLNEPGNVTNPTINDNIFSVSATGTVTLFAALVPEADPNGLEFPPVGSPFGDFLFVASNNRDGGQLGDQGGTIQRVDPAGNVSDFTAIGLPQGLGEPASMAFGPGGQFGTDLFVANSNDLPADIVRVDPSGSIQSFVNDTQFFSGLAPCDLEFAPGGAFGSDLYFSDFGEACNCLRIADTTGNITSPFVTLPGRSDLEFSPGGPFGNDLYVAVTEAGGGSIFRVQSDGAFSLFASGFVVFSCTDALEFSLDGSALFVADFDGNTVYKITAADIDGDGIPDDEDASGGEPSPARPAGSSLNPGTPGRNRCLTAAIALTSRTSVAPMVDHAQNQSQECGEGRGGPITTARHRGRNQHSLGPSALSAVAERGDAAGPHGS